MELTRHQQTTATTVLMEFSAVGGNRSFWKSLPNRKSAKIIAIDPLESVADSQVPGDEYPTRVAEQIAAMGAREVRLCANCRGAALLAPVAHQLTKLSVHVDAILAVDPLIVTRDLIAESLLEIAERLKPSRVTISNSIAFPAAVTLLRDWIGEYLRDSGIDSEDADTFRIELLELYSRWIAYQEWAISSTPPPIDCANVTVVTIGDPGQPARIFNAATSYHEARYGSTGTSALENPDVIAHIRKFASIA